MNSYSTPLSQWGLSSGRSLKFSSDVSDLAIGRVIINHGNHADVVVLDTPSSENLENFDISRVELGAHLPDTPVAGDWVCVQGGRIVEIAERYSSLSRPDVDGTFTQVLAANIDTALLVISLEKEPSLKALEKLLIMGWDSGAQPIIIATKIDVAKHYIHQIERLQEVSMGVEIIPCSSQTGEGIELVKERVSGGTAVMLGASGAGKTSLLNALSETHEATFDVRRDGQGRHTTSTRKLYRLPGGGILLDVPGIRTLSLNGDSTAINETFSDIAELSLHCRFGDCQHDGDFGCAVEAAVDHGELSPRRLKSWRSIQRELEYQTRRTSKSTMAEQKRQWKKSTKATRKFSK
ncbi:MAG: ribosome small subunit-dependent GTPase A [Rothia sp. (in: high G+C Gram-positive bacteria)]|nr:ribosome small subunit-dependent GTPase A [Rothia sp. (in: high G+C Gram-positive bacteria)]